MFEAGLLGTLEDIGYSIRNNAFIATHPEIWESNMRRSTGDCSAASRGVRAVKTDESTAKLLEEKEARLASNENLTEEMREQILAFIGSMAECVDDFVWKANEFEGREDLYTYPELEYPEYVDYGSNEFEYPTKAKAKAACKAAVGSMVDAVKENYEQLRGEIISCTREYYSELENKFNEFIDEFIETYDDYASVECDEDMAREYVLSRKAELFGKESLEKEALEYNLEAGFHTLADERSGVSVTEIFDKRKYFKMCEYDEDEEEGYCYIMGDACDGIYEEASRFLMEEVEAFPENVFKTYMTAIVSFCEILKNKLAEL